MTSVIGNCEQNAFNYQYKLWTISKILSQKLHDSIISWFDYLVEELEDQETNLIRQRFDKFWVWNIKQTRPSQVCSLYTVSKLCPGGILQFIVWSVFLLPLQELWAQHLTICKLLRNVKTCFNGAILHWSPSLSFIGRPTAEAWARASLAMSCVYFTSYNNVQRNQSR